MCTYKDKYIPMLVRRPRLSSRQPFKNTVPRRLDAKRRALNTAAIQPGLPSSAICLMIRVDLRTQVTSSTSAQCVRKHAARVAFVTQGHLGMVKFLNAYTDRFTHWMLLQHKRLSLL